MCMLLTSGGRKYFSLIFEIFFISLLVTVSVINSERFLRSWHGPGGSITTDLYIPSVMFACGHGLVNVNPSEIPHLRAFLEFAEQTFSGEYIPEDVKYLELDGYQSCHLYLVYTVGIIWRLFGVSWEVLRWFLVGLFAVTTLIIYGIARIFLPSFLSIVVGYSFLREETALIILPILRDFIRGTFILAVLFTLFNLLKGKNDRRRYLLNCCSIGLTCGLGMGFRQELLMFFILSLLVLVIIPIDKHLIKFPSRCLGIGITIVIFIISSYPVLKAYHHYGTYGFHHTLMGFATEHDDLAGLERTNYERIYKYDDMLVSASADIYSCLQNSPKEKNYPDIREPEWEKRKLILAYFYWFPADILVRIYSAIARITDHIITSALPVNLYRTFLSIGIILLFIAMDFHKGVCFGLILLYSMAIQTLQFNFRHSFYLLFLPWLLYALLIYWLFKGAYVLWEGGRNSLKDNIEKLTGIVKRFIVFGLLAIGISEGILFIARQIQTHQLSRLFNSYRTAEYESLSYKTYSAEKGVVYSLDKPLSIQLEERPTPDCFFVANVLVIDFLVDQFPVCFELIYDGVNDFSYTLTITNPGMSKENNHQVRYFLPVYENMSNLKNDWNRFIGFRISDTTNMELVGIHRICNLKDLPILMNCYFIDDKFTLPYYQRLASYSSAHINPCWRPYGISDSQRIVNDAKVMFSKGDKGRSFEILWDAMKREPYLLKYGLVLAELYEREGEIEMCKYVYEQLISNRPHDPIPAIKLDALLSRGRFSMEEKQQFWGDMINKYPESSMVWLYYSKYQNENVDANESLLRAVKLNKYIDNKVSEFKWEWCR
ncbi:MAG: hypothetical protein N3G21_04310 [Candidatus Hydrogenedentes bacterium]|nr:hypothetical protein [Candidatus Hydrogenedentota bacterium]